MDKGKRTDKGSKFIKAPADLIYNAFLDPTAVAIWRPPGNMRCKIYRFDAREGGGYRMSFIYQDAGPGVKGKTDADADVFTGRFTELIPSRKIVEEVLFESDDPAFDEPMTITTLLKPVDDGTEVSFTCTNVPESISPEDHQKGMESTLKNLAAFTEP